MSRLALFSFYEKSGIVRSYIYYYLEQLAVIADIVFIANGSLQTQSKSELERKGCRVICRENSGFDFGAWKAFLISEKTSLLAQYEELILCNSSCYGPVYSFLSIFDEMSRISCDFWGLYRHPGIRDKKHSIPPHIQSYFIVLRKKLFHSECFHEFFSGLDYAVSWNDAVKQETFFTEYFEERGFSSYSFCGSVLSEYIENPTIFMPADLLERRFPLIKRKCFTTEYSYINKMSSATQIKRLIAFLKMETDYPADLIFEDLLGTMKNSELIKALGLSYVLPGDSENTAAEPCGVRVAAVLRSCSGGRVAENISYLRSLPDGSSIFIVAVSEELVDEWKAKLPLLDKYLVEILQLGRNVLFPAAYWLVCREAISSSDYICLLHDPEGEPSSPKVKDFFFYDHCFSSLLFSRQYVRNIIALFQGHERLGMLMPFVPMFAEWPDRMLNEEYGDCLENAERICSMLQLSVPFDEHPVAPWGGMFWLRGRAMDAFYRHEWTCDDFDSGKIGNDDGNAVQALIRLYPMIVQESGFFAGCICPSELAGCQFSNMYFSLQKYSTVKINHEKVHFSDVRKILSVYLKRKVRGFFSSD